jgi:hypothetical protein
MKEDDGGVNQRHCKHIYNCHNESSPVQIIYANKIPFFSANKIDEN